jgi:hypothetical protein
MEEMIDLQKLFPDATKSFMNRLFDLYPASKFNSTFFQRQQLFGDFIINCPTYFMSRAVSDSGNPAYILIFYAGNELHGALIPFTETVNLKGIYMNAIQYCTYPMLRKLTGDSNNATLADIVRNYYVSFAIGLDPNYQSFTKFSHPFWPTYQNSDNGNFSALEITYTTISVTQDTDVSPQCDFFSSQSYVVRN